MAATRAATIAFCFRVVATADSCHKYGSTSRRFPEDAEPAIPTKFVDTENFYTCSASMACAVADFSFATRNYSQ